MKEFFRWKTEIFFCKSGKIRPKWGIINMIKAEFPASKAAG